MENHRLFLFCVRKYIEIIRVLLSKKELQIVGANCVRPF